MSNSTRFVWMIVACCLAQACSSADTSGDRMPNGGSAAIGGSGGMGGSIVSGSGGGGTGGTRPPFDGGVEQDAGGEVIVQDPKDCAEAAANKSYIGCDYWPTVLPNMVHVVFDYTVVVSNPGTTVAEITVTGGALTAPETATVMPGEIAKIYLPWVSELKGPGIPTGGSIADPLSGSVIHAGGAYHLVSTSPVLVYQFNPLEYRGTGGPEGKDWSACGSDDPSMCFAYSNDASLLLPSTAMTGNYRVVAFHGVDATVVFGLEVSKGFQAYFSVTATEDNTTVNVQISSTGEVMAGGGIAALAAGATASFMMNEGDVALFVSPAKTAADLTGSQVQADKPVQVMGGSPCIYNPMDQGACDHIEEIVMPAETLGQNYVVAMPTGPGGTQAPASVRFVGNVDGTQLTYEPALAGAPATLNAGQVVELTTVTTNFVVRGDHEFAVSIVQQGASVVDPMTAMKGDPALSAATAIEQFRKKYVFLTPDDYDLSFADVVAPTDAMLTLDAAPVTVAPTPIGAEYVVYRIPLSAGNDGGHTLESDQAVGLQAIGYGSYTSYQYPGGLNLRSIAPPPPPIALE